MFKIGTFITAPAERLGSFYMPGQWRIALEAPKTTFLILAIMPDEGGVAYVTDKGMLFVWTLGALFAGTDLKLIEVIS